MTDLDDFCREVVPALRSSLAVHADVDLRTWSSVAGATCGVWTIKNLPLKAGRVMGIPNIPAFGARCSKNLTVAIKDIQLHESLK